MARTKEINIIPITLDLVRQVLPPRPRDADKEHFGRALVIAGSRGMLGAALLSSRAVLRAGAGISVLGVPRPLAKYADAASPEVMTLELPTTREETIAPAAVPSIVKMTSRMKAVALGPGLSRNKHTRNFVKKTIRILRHKYPTCKLVIDADGLPGLTRFRWVTKEAIPVITPHKGELSRVMKVPLRKIDVDPLYYAIKAARKFKVIVVLKGAETIVVSPLDTIVFINQTGNAGMATGGSGDVLTGIITGLLAQGLEPRTAAVAGVFIHGLAGNIAALKLGQDGIIASNILDAVPSALKRIREK